MNIWTLSDIHFTIPEAWGLLQPFAIPDADICVVAGDMCDDLVPALKWLGKVIRPHMPVVTVLGNHDFYGHDIPAGRRRAAELASDFGLTLLDDTAAVVGGVRFVGGTLWTDYRLFESLSNPPLFTQSECMYAAKDRFGDFQEIWATEASDRMMARLIYPKELVRLHEQTVSYIDGILSEPFDGATVVVTHHAPCPRSVHQKFVGDVTSAAFVSDLSGMIEVRQPEVWIHGHVHDSFDYEVGLTRVLSNPRGYDRFPNLSFDPGLVIEVPASHKRQLR